MRVLVTQSYFGLGGTETYSATVAEGLERLGHRVTIHAWDASSQGREVAARRALELSVGELLPAGVDAVLAQDAASAQLLAGRDPAPRQLFTMHGFAPFEHPPRGLDPAPPVVVLNDRTAHRAAALAESPRVVRLRQPIDLAHFRPRTPAPPRPRRLLLLSNGIGAGRLRTLEEACEGLGLELLRVGGPTPSLAPQEAIAAADIVVGYGRSVLEAMAMGRPAYVWERAGGDGWVTPETYPAFEANGFNGGSPEVVIDGARLREDLAGYRPELGDLGFELVRNNHSAAKHVEVLVGLLSEGVAPRRQEAGETIALLARAEKRAMSRAEGAAHGHGELLEWNAALERQVRDLTDRVATAEAGAAAARQAADAAEARHGAELQALLRSTSWRLTAPLRRLRTKLGRPIDKGGAEDS